MIYVILAIAIALTFVALRVGLILFRVAAAVSWLSMLIYFLMSGTFKPSEPFVYVMCFAIVAMIAAVFTLQIVTEVQREKDGRRWVTWGKPPKEDVELRSTAVKREHRDRLRAIRERRYR